MSLEVLIYFGIGVTVGGFIIFLWQRSENAKTQAQNQILLQYVPKNEELNSENQSLRVQLAEKTKEMELQLGHIGWLESAEEKLKEAFRALSDSALIHNSNRFLEQAKEQIGQISTNMKSDWNEQKEAFSGIISPIAKELGSLDQQVRALEQKREGAYQGLNSQVEYLLKSTNQLQHQTISLTQALRSTGVRAKWGEMQLKRLAELAGMVEHVDFTEQATNESGTRPDMIIELPGGGFIPIDAKVPMNAYLESLEANDENIRTQKLKAHLAAVRQHIKTLSSKEYWKQSNAKTAPELAVMLVPYESGLSAAFAEDPSIFDDALAAKVVLCTPATLLALLKVFAVGWMQLKLSENAQLIADQGRILYERILKFIEHFSSVGTKIEGLVDTYNKATSSLDARVIPALRKIKELGAGSDEPISPVQIDVKTRDVKNIE